MVSRLAANVCKNGVQYTHYTTHITCAMYLTANIRV
jgi:hypothetical protein